MSELKARDGTSLHLHRWPASEPKAAVVLLHGYGEHAGRYAHVAAAWNQDGLSVFAVDLRGHGRSGGARGHVDRFADYHQDAEALLARAREEIGDKPLLLFGHSMGALVASDWMLAGGGGGLKATAFSSPLLGVALKVPAAKELAGKVMSRIWPTLALPSGIKGEHVTRDPEKAAEYDRDPLNLKKAGARWYTESMAAIDRVLGRAGDLKLPTILLYGGADRLTSAPATDRFAAALAMSDRTVDRLVGHYHELVNEPPAVRDPIIARYGRWLVEHA